MTTGPTDHDAGALPSTGDLPDGTAVPEAVRHSRMSQLAGPDFSVAEAVGGVRGLVESIAPGLVFVVVFLATGQELMPPLIASLAVAVVLVVARLIGGTPITQALGGTIGVAIGVLWAWRSGEAQDYFVFGLWTNAAYAVALLVSVLVRWPIVGVVVALLRQEGFSWRTDPALRPRLRRYTVATWLWIALFLVRLAVQVPLYLTAATAWLGTARLVMGVPLWALVLWFTWLLVRERPVERSAQ